CAPAQLTMPPPAHNPCLLAKWFVRLMPCTPEAVMKIWGLASIEKGARPARDPFIVRPPGRSRMIQPHAPCRLHYSFKINSDHNVAYKPRGRGSIVAHLARYGEWLRDDFRNVLLRLATHGRSTKGKVFVDVGANVGTQTIYALVANDFARVVAIEPAPENLTL